MLSDRILLARLTNVITNVSVDMTPHQARQALESAFAERFQDKNNHKMEDVFMVYVTLI